MASARQTQVAKRKRRQRRRARPTGAPGREQVLRTQITTSGLMKRVRCWGPAPVRRATVSPKSSSLDLDRHLE
jgi:hypothetical protein